MFENLSYKQKFFALVAIISLMALTGYKRSVKLTLDSYRNCKQATAKLQEVNNSWQRMRSLENEVGYLDNIIGRQAADPDIVQQEILSTFSLLDTDAELVKLAEVHKANNEYFNIYTNQLLLSGNFNNILGATYEYEKNFDFSRLVSLNFYTEKERRSRRLKLYGQLIFQNYEKIP